MLEDEYQQKVNNYIASLSQEQLKQMQDEYEFRRKQGESDEQARQETFGKGLLSALGLDHITNPISKGVDEFGQKLSNAADKLWDNKTYIDNNKSYSTFETGADGKRYETSRTLHLNGNSVTLRYSPEKAEWLSKQTGKKIDEDNFLDEMTKLHMRLAQGNKMFSNALSKLSTAVATAPITLTAANTAGKVMANPVVQFGFGADAFNRFTSADGIRKSFRRVGEGDYAGAAKSFVGDLFDSMMVNAGFRAIPAMADVRFAKPSSLKNWLTGKKLINTGEKAEWLENLGINPEGSGMSFANHMATSGQQDAGKGLKLYFALSPARYAESTIPVIDASDKALYEETPLAFKVKSNLSVKRAKQLIADVMSDEGLERGEPEKTDWVKQVRADLREEKKAEKEGKQFLINRLY